MKYLSLILLSYFLVDTFLLIKSWIFYKVQKSQLESMDKELNDTLNFSINNSMNRILLNILLIIILILYISISFFLWS